MANFEDWLKNNHGFLIEKLEIYDFKETGRGMKAIQNIESEEIIVEMPKSLLITRHNLKDIHSSIVITNEKALTEIESLALWVLMESKNTQQSSWRFYLESLPDHFNTVLMTLDESDIPHLPVYLYTKVIKQLKEAENAFTKFKTEFIHDLSWNQFLWAWLAVNTRCITLNSKDMNATVALAPFLDCLNHSIEAKVTTFFDSDSKSFKIITHIPYKKDEQVFISYGPHDNHFLFTEYGFILGNNPFDHIDVTVLFWEFIQLVNGIVECKPVQNEYQIKEHIFELGLSLDFVICKEDGMGFPLMTAVRLCYLQHEHPLSNHMISVLYDDEYVDSTHKRNCEMFLESFCEFIIGKLKSSHLYFDSLRKKGPLYEMSCQLIEVDIQIIEKHSKVVKL